MAIDSYPGSYAGSDISQTGGYDPRDPNRSGSSGGTVDSQTMQRRKRYYDQYKKNFKAKLTQGEIDAQKGRKGLIQKLFGDTLPMELYDAITDEMIAEKMAEDKLSSMGYGKDTYLGSKDTQSYQQMLTDQSKDDAAVPSGSDQGGLLNNQGKYGRQWKPKDAENRLLDLFMDIYENPDMNPADLVSGFMKDVQKGQDRFLGDMDKVSKRSMRGQRAFTDEMDRISGLGGTALSFGGKPIMTTTGERQQIRPLNYMRTAGDLASQRLGGILDTQGLMKDTATGRLGGLLSGTGARYDMGVKPLIDKHGEMYGIRKGAPQKGYEPTWYDKLIPVLFS